MSPLAATRTRAPASPFWDAFDATIASPRAALTRSQQGPCQRWRKGATRVAPTFTAMCCRHGQHDPARPPSAVPSFLPHPRGEPLRPSGERLRDDDGGAGDQDPVSYTHLRAHETPE